MIGERFRSQAGLEVEDFVSRIVSVEGWTLGLPMARPVVFAGTRYDDRAYSIVRLVDSDGAVGFAYCLSRNGPLTETVKALAAMLIGVDPWMSRSTWDHLYEASIPFGQRGLALRAISLLDVATWDLKGQLTGQPVHALLGSARSSVPASAGGGYFRESRSPEDIAAELRGYVDEGFKMIKIPGGGLSADEEEVWIRRAREAVGEDVGLAVDTHWTWHTVTQAAAVLRRWDAYHLAWIEDPLWPEELTELGRLHEMLDTPLGIGDELSGRWVYRALATEKLTDMWRVDVMTVGGFTEYQRVCALAEIYGVSLATHIYPEIHVHCAASSDAVEWTEYVSPESGIDLSHQFIDAPVRPEAGMLAAPRGPGLGFDLDWDQIEKTASVRFGIGEGLGHGAAG